jgi:septum formation protein
VGGAAGAGSGGAALSLRQRGGLVLGSASPRRRDLLAATGLAFEVEVSDVDESLAPGLEPEVAARELARRKALVVAARHRGEQCWVIGADTVVAVGQGPTLELLGKPEDARQARGMLEALSGSRHRVVTGVAVIDCATWRRGASGEAATSEACERTWVAMRDITSDEVAAYVASGEWRDKAGGYAIQENADVFVTSLSGGGFDNVVGLPVGLTLDLLRAAGALEP